MPGDRAEDPVASRKRPRAARACEFCRARKYRCDEGSPCTRCSRAKVPCVYESAYSLRQRLVADARDAAQDSIVLAFQEPSAAPNQSSPACTPQQNNPMWSGMSTEFHQHRPATPDVPGTWEDQEGNGEVNEVNPHTQSLEFHGPTSSLAFLAALQHSGVKAFASSTHLGTQALVSALHNESFSPHSLASEKEDSFAQTRFFFRQSHYFLDGYFKNIHFIHPIIDQSQFLSRCEDLWFGRREKQNAGFIALYFAVMSLGALIHEWNDELIEGLGRWAWSRKLFELASLTLGCIPAKFDLDTVQAMIVLAKVCQNELNPHLAYMYLGMAVRASLSAGHNRQPRRMSPPINATDIAISKTWWGLYSVEMEISFALGRTDSLGPDIYHNRALLATTCKDEAAILAPMVEFARIIRRISSTVYMPSTTIEQRVQYAIEIETELTAWVAGLPSEIRPHLDQPDNSIGLTKDPTWAKKQRHTLRFRYYNAMMVLFRPFLLHACRHRSSRRSGITGMEESLSKCVVSAGSTIRLMHHLYSSASYFRTWYYNITYTLYAASIILGYVMTLASAEERPQQMHLLHMSVEVLQAMDDHSVAKKACDLLQSMCDKMQDSSAHTEYPEDSASTSTIPSAIDSAHDSFLTGDIFLNFLGDASSEFADQTFPFDFTVGDV